MLIVAYFIVHWVNKMLLAVHHRSYYPHRTRQTYKTDLHAPKGIRTRDPRNQRRCRPLGPAPFRFSDQNIV